MRREICHYFQRLQTPLSAAALAAALIVSGVAPVWSAEQADAGASADTSVADTSVSGKKPHFTKTGPRTVPSAMDAKSIQLMNKFYDRLAKAEDAHSAGMLENAIEIMWQRSGSDTIDLLMARSLTALKNQDPELALKLLDSVTELAPNYTEGWNRKAYVHFSQKQYAHALHDLRHALALDPRHFKAIDGLANVLREIGDKKRALQIYRTLHKVHPFWHGAKPAIEELEREVEGQRI